MNVSWSLFAAALTAGHLLIGGALAAPPPGSGMGAPAGSGLVRIQAVPPTEAAIQDRMARLWQHRDILQNALQPPVGASPAEAPEPQTRALRPPEPMIATAPPPEDPAGDGPGQLTCEDAAGIVARFGFSDIGMSDCSGDLYKFSAVRDGTAYAIGINAATGEIAEVSRQ